MIIVCGGEKGGVGKTTFATNLAAMRLQRKGDLLLIDTDIQGSASAWCQFRDSCKITPRIPSIQKFGRALQAEIISLSQKYADIVIDAGGADSVELRGALLAADIAIIPLKPAQLDLWSIARMTDLMRDITMINQALKIIVCINQASTHPLTKETEAAKEFLGEFAHITITPAIICERIAVRRATMRGQSVEELNTDAKASGEFLALYEDIYDKA